MFQNRKVCLCVCVSVPGHESDPANPITGQSGKRENQLSQLLFSLGIFWKKNMGLNVSTIRSHEAFDHGQVDYWRGAILGTLVFAFAQLLSSQTPDRKSKSKSVSQNRMHTRESFSKWWDQSAQPFFFKFFHLKFFNFKFLMRRTLSAIASALLLDVSHCHGFGLML